MNGGIFAPGVHGGIEVESLSGGGVGGEPEGFGVLELAAGELGGGWGDGVGEGFAEGEVVLGPPLVVVAVGGIGVEVGHVGVGEGAEEFGGHAGLVGARAEAFVDGEVGLAEEFVGGGDSAVEVFGVFVLGVGDGVFVHDAVEERGDPFEIGGIPAGVGDDAGVGDFVADAGEEFGPALFGGGVEAEVVDVEAGVVVEGAEGGDGAGGDVLDVVVVGEVHVVAAGPEGDAFAVGIFLPPGAVGGVLFFFGFEEVDFDDRGDVGVEGEEGVELLAGGGDGVGGEGFGEAGGEGGRPFEVEVFGALEGDGAAGEVGEAVVGFGVGGVGPEEGGGWGLGLGVGGVEGRGEGEEGREEDGEGFGHRVSLG